ncbi:MAG: hypothetical protein H7039_23115, partial [Bryobacteraceae bacterium]|nr:hypothetical protein [Bryobacteraceae bacterium]
RKVANVVKNKVQDVLVYAGLSKRLTPFEQIVATLQASMSIEPVRKSDIVTISLRTPDREGGIAILNKFLDIYLKQHIEVYKTPRARKFFEQESTTLRDRVLDVHKGTHTFREASGVWELGEQRQLLLKQKSDLEGTYMNTISNLRLLKQEIAKFVELKSGMPGQVELTRVSERNPVIKNLDEHLGQLEASREQALTKFTPEGRVVTDLANQIARLRAMRAREEQLIVNSVTSTRNDNLVAVEKAILDKRAMEEGLSAQKQEQERQIRDIEARLALLDSSEVEVERRNREIALLNKNFHLYAEKLEDARISEAMDIASISNVTVVAPATGGVMPVWPNKRTWTVMALALGIGGSLGIAFAREMVQPTARSRKEVADVAGAPVLAVIAEAPGTRFRSRPPGPERPLVRAAGSGSTGSLL